MLQPSIPKSQKTILLDEPERGLDVQHKLEFVKEIKKLVRKKFQIVLVVHCPLIYYLLQSLASNIIETSVDYEKLLNNTFQSINVIN